MAIQAPQLTADAPQSGRVILRWTPSLQARQIEIQRDGARLVTRPDADAQWLDATVVPGRTYAWRAKFRHKDSGWSNTVSMTIPSVPLPPEPPPEPPAPPTMVDTGWTTYGHDAQRTSASSSALCGPLTMAWRWRPPIHGDGRPEPQAVVHAVAEASGIYARYRVFPQDRSCYARLKADSTLVRAIEITGYNYDLCHWATLGPGWIAYNSDAMNLVYTAGGTVRGYWDCWGEIALSPDGRTLYSCNIDDADNLKFGLCLWAWGIDAQGQLVERWRAMDSTAPPYRLALNANGGKPALTEDGGRLLFPFLPWLDTERTETPDVVDAVGWDAGLYAFDTAAGAAPPVWHAPGAPMSGVSIREGLAYIVEKPEAYQAVPPRRGYTISPGSLLCCYRIGGSGSLVWSQPVTEAGFAAPCLAGDLVLITERNAVVAFDRLMGEVKWRAAAPGVGHLGLLDGEPYSPTWHTSLAAALGSGTLMAAGDELHMLNLKDGGELWRGHPGQGKCVNPIIYERRLYVIDTLNSYPSPSWVGPAWPKLWGTYANFTNNQWALLALDGGA